MKIEIQLVPYQDTLHMRSRVLKPHLRPEECINPGDLKSDSFHYAAFLKDKMIGIASFEYEAHPDLPAKKSARLRGMATDPEVRRQGVGRQLVESGLEHLQKEGADLLWFNAREVAFPFYQSLGFQFHGESFELPQIGPHKVMYKYLK